MDDWTRMEVEGLEELDQKLTKLTNELAGKALFSALNVALTPVVKTAKSRALVAKEPHTMTLKSGRKVEVKGGLLASSIRKRRLPKREHTGEFAQGAAMGVYVGEGTKQKLYPNYWHFVEYGTPKMPATPFLRPAFDNNVNTMIERFGDKLSSNIDKFVDQMNNGER